MVLVPVVAAPKTRPNFFSLDFVSGAVSPPDGSVLIGGGNSVCLGAFNHRRSWELPGRFKVWAAEGAKCFKGFFHRKIWGCFTCSKLRVVGLEWSLVLQGPTVRFLSGTQMLRSEDDILNESEEDELSDEVR